MERAAPSSILIVPSAGIIGFADTLTSTSLEGEKVEGGEGLLRPQPAVGTGGVVLGPEAALEARVPADDDQNVADQSLDREHLPEARDLVLGRELPREHDA